MYDVISEWAAHEVKVYRAVDPEIFNVNQPGITVEKGGFKTIEGATDAIKWFKSRDAAK